MKDNCLLVFLTSPCAEKIPSALKEVFGSEKACHIYMEMARHIFSTAKKYRNISATAVYQSDSKHPDLRWLDADDPGFLSPRGETPAERAQAASRWAFDAGAQRVVILSVQSPGVPQDWLEKAFAMLAEKDFVLGPAQDGECYLLGMRAPNPMIFEEGCWAGGPLFEQISERAKRSRLTTYSLAEFCLIKDEKTYLQWESSLHKPAHSPKPADQPKPKNTPGGK